MARRRRIRAIFTFSKSVPQFMNDALAFKQALSKASGNTVVSVPPEIISRFETNFAELKSKQAVTSRQRRGSGSARDLPLNKVVRDVRHLVSKVQAAADQAPDILTSVAIIKNCGLRPRKERVVVKPDFEVRRDKKVSGLVHLISKAAHKRDRGAYLWEVSLNGKTFTHVKTSTECRTTWQTGVAPGTKLTFRRGLVTNKSDGVPVWSQSFTLIIT